MFACILDPTQTSRVASCWRPVQVSHLLLELFWENARFGPQLICPSHHSVLKKTLRLTMSWQNGIIPDFLKMLFFHPAPHIRLLLPLQGLLQSESGNRSSGEGSSFPQKH